ncbi:MAG: four helix bundle protein [Sphingobacteriales bacterium JAD_PAG50586_3]|nr:MAG: four helix bundle protein [Sphingobacteriales bacterium JAD_PAG50586_3]
MSYGKNLHDHKELIAWQKSIILVEEVYKMTQSFPKEEMFGIISQMRRCAISIPSNIAEGHSRNSTGEFKQFLGIAKGSSAELETQLIIANNLGFIKDEKLKEVNDLLVDVRKLISGLLRSLNKS